MADVDDLDHIVGGRVEDLVTISSQNLHTDIRIGRQWCRTRVCGNLVDRMTNRTKNVLRARWAALVQKLENALKVRERKLTIANPHASPWRFQNAAACSSDAKPPRRASAIARRSASLNV